MNQNKYTYLFVKMDGYGGREYTYFSTDKEITQEMADRFIRKANKTAGRTGSNFDDFKSGANHEGIIIDKLYGQHKVDGVLENIIGNY